MQIKKNPKADLTKNSNLYFAIGLVIILLFHGGLLNGSHMTGLGMDMKP